MIQIRPFKKADTLKTALLITKVFKEFNRFEASPKGLNKFSKSYDPKYIPFEDLYKKLHKPFSFVAVETGDVVGVIRGDSERIFSLFIDGSFQRQGIGKKLVETYLKAIKKQGSKFVKVRSSILAVPFYASLDFKKTTGVRNPHGIKMINMKKFLS